jgi:hypothetical protein
MATLAPSVFNVSPMRDMGSPSGEDETWFVPCEAEDAEQWTVFYTPRGERADPLPVADFATKDEADKLAAEIVNLRPGDVFETMHGWFVVIDSHDFAADGPMTEAEAREHGDTFA